MPSDEEGRPSGAGMVRRKGPFINAFCCPTEEKCMLHLIYIQHMLFFLWMAACEPVTVGLALVRNSQPITGQRILGFLRLDIIWKEVITASSRILIRYSNFRSSHRDRYQEIGKSVSTDCF